MTPDSVWFWLVIGVGTVALTASGRWVFMSVAQSFRTWITGPVQEAKERATVAADHAEKVNEAIGVPNGHGDLMTMAARVLTNQQTQFDWMREHDTKDDAMSATLRQTRDDVLKMQHELGSLSEKVANLELTRAPFESSGEQTG